MYFFYKLPMVTWKNYLWLKNGVTVTRKDSNRHHPQTEVWKIWLEQKGQRKEEKSFQTRCLLWNLRSISKLSHLHSGNCRGLELFRSWKPCVVLRSFLRSEAASSFVSEHWGGVWALWAIEKAAFSPRWCQSMASQRHYQYTTYSSEGKEFYYFF